MDSAYTALLIASRRGFRSQRVRERMARELRGERSPLELATKRGHHP